MATKEPTIHRTPQEQLTPKQRETLEKLEKSRKHIEADVAEVLKKHGFPGVSVLELRCGFPPPGGCYCNDGNGWYCCEIVGGQSGG